MCAAGQWQGVSNFARKRHHDTMQGEMAILILQLVILCALAVTLALTLAFFPHPSPLLRRWLPPRKRWPEAQVREWLQSTRFQKSFLRYFYRDPERAPLAATGMLAPADGLVTSTDVRDGIRYLVIALSFWDMHVQRCPLAGKILKVEAQGDAFMDGEGREFVFLRAKPCPVQQRVVMETAAGEIAVRLITSVAARRIEVWVQAGETVQRGQRIGRILLGSTVVLELPPGVPLQVCAGQRVRAGETIVSGEAAP